MDRIGRLLGTAHRSQQILEIGAGYSPVAPKAAGWHTHVVDHAPQNELQDKYSHAGVDVSLIEDVDTIWRGGRLHEAVPELLNKVDLIIASHVLEHIPNLIGFLQSASLLVRHGGFLSIALPDRRYCFDCFRPWTTTGGLLEAHHLSLDRHGLKTAFDHMAYSAASDGQIAWGPRPVGEPVLLDPFAAAATTVSMFDSQVNRPYQDYHAWQFTPAGFQLAMLELGALGLTDWQVSTLHGPENFEFFAVLTRGTTEQLDPTVLQTKRQGLLLAQLAETQQQINFIIKAAEASTDRGPDQYKELAARLNDHDHRLQEMAETLSWLRTVLGPCRRAWRTLRGRNTGAITHAE